MMWSLETGDPTWGASLGKPPLLFAPRPSRDSRRDLNPPSESSIHGLIGAMVPPSGRYWSGPRWRRGGPQPRGGANDRQGWRFSTIAGRTAPPAPGLWKPGFQAPQRGPNGRPRRTPELTQPAPNSPRRPSVCEAGIGEPTALHSPNPLFSRPCPARRWGLKQPRTAERRVTPLTLPTALSDATFLTSY